MRKTWKTLGAGMFTLAVAGALGVGATQAVAEPSTPPSAVRSCDSCNLDCALAGCLGRCVNGGCYCLCN